MPHFLAGPTERTKKVWNECLKALEEERTNNGVRSLDNVTVSTITSHKAGYIDRENELIVGLQNRRTAAPCHQTLWWYQSRRKSLP